jgi:hypothetical protein
MDVGKYLAPSEIGAVLGDCLKVIQLEMEPFQALEDM